MILVVLGVSVLLFIAAVVFINDYELSDMFSFFSALLFIAAFIATIVIGVQVKKISLIDDRIAMYKEENAVIEQQIADVVEQYQKYETDIFMEVAPESAVSMVALYPELKSDSLVQAQIEVYVANNNMIKELKDQQIKGDVYRWWLYFGGGRIDG